MFPKIGVFPPKWVFYNGKTLLQWMIWGGPPPIFGWTIPLHGARKVHEGVNNLVGAEKTCHTYLGCQDDTGEAVGDLSLEDFTPVSCFLSFFREIQRQDPQKLEHETLAGGWCLALHHLCWAEDLHQVRL